MCSGTHNPAPRHYHRSILVVGSREPHPRRMTSGIRPHREQGSGSSGSSLVKGSLPLLDPHPDGPTFALRARPLSAASGFAMRRFRLATGLLFCVVAPGLALRVLFSATVLRPG
jgi:hypothetical protein